MEVFNHYYQKQISDREIFVTKPLSYVEIDSGAVYGFLQFGEGYYSGTWKSTLKMDSGDYFAYAGECSLSFKNANSFLLCVKDENPFFHLGKLEQGEGRLKYIDGCTDSLLISPVKKGMPCLNHLHFPKETKQSFHTHPSYRCGIVAYGTGYAETGKGATELKPGMCWFIPKNELHRFFTEGSELGVIAYHPDSDFGPVDENHPMINRTVL